MVNCEILNTISSPEELKKLKQDQVKKLCGEIRDFLIDSVSKTGGHLASNLGAIELTVACHRVFDFKKDAIVFDVGHQCYTHKILTGRKDQFDGLRSLNGISGFPNPEESPYDSFVAGHGNTSLSVAIGIANAKKIKHESGKVIAFIGDGAFTGGMVYEGMNNIGELDNLIVILNDNKMSISKNVGSLARHLTALRTAPFYQRTKENVSTAMDTIPILGHSIVELIQNQKTMWRRSIYHSDIFEEMGFQYVGPIDGHNVISIEDLLKRLQKYQDGPVLMHAVTVKGKGFKPAEENPGEFHGVSAFDLNHVTNPEVSPKLSFSTVFGEKLTQIAQNESLICSVTAAMKYGTGLDIFSKEFPERFFDVGMAEQHAVTFAAGMASKGMLPVVALYSTFLQRAYDQLIHDVKLMDLNVILAIDRAGLVPGDGCTHQGIYDVAFLSEIGIPVYSPSNYSELQYWLQFLTSQNFKGPRAIRYPRGQEEHCASMYSCTEKEFDILESPNSNHSDLAIISYGAIINEAIKCQGLLVQNSIACDVVKLIKVFPFSSELILCCQKYDTIVFAEDTVFWGGAGKKLEAALHSAGWKGRFICKAIHDPILPHASVSEIRHITGLDSESIYNTILENQH